MKTILVDAVDCFIIEKDGSFEVFKEMFDILEEYDNNKIVLTGANDEQYEEFNLKKCPYEIFTMKHDPEKTDPKYYEILLEKYKLNPEEVVYFEHNPKAVESAKSVGIKSYFYDNDSRDLEFLRIFLDESL